MKGPRPYLLAYDIADPRRLARIARTVSREALRIQYSVYVTELAPAQLRDLVARLHEAIDPKADDLRIYPLPSRPDAVWYGHSIWPDGVQFESPLLAKLTASEGAGYRADTGHPAREVDMTNYAEPENSANRPHSSLKTEKKLAIAVQKQT